VKRSLLINILKGFTKWIKGWQCSKNLICNFVIYCTQEIKIQFTLSADFVLIIERSSCFEKNIPENYSENHDPLQNFSGVSYHRPVQNKEDFLNLKAGPYSR